jgi:hypothetical protein
VPARTCVRKRRRGVGRLQAALQRPSARPRRASYVLSAGDRRAVRDQPRSAARRLLSVRPSRRARTRRRSSSGRAG